MDADDDKIEASLEQRTEHLQKSGEQHWVVFSNLVMLRKRDDSYRLDLSLTIPSIIPSLMPMSRDGVDLRIPPAEILAKFVKKFSG